jgi:hypothetical protein
MEQREQWDVIMPHMLVEAALIVEECGPPFEQRASAEEARRGIARARRLS